MVGASCCTAASTARATTLPAPKTKIKIITCKPQTARLRIQIIFTALLRHYICEAHRATLLCNGCSDGTRAAPLGCCGRRAEREERRGETEGNGTDGLESRRRLPSRVLGGGGRTTHKSCAASRRRCPLCEPDAFRRLRTSAACATDADVSSVRGAVAAQAVTVVGRGAGRVPRRRCLVAYAESSGSVVSWSTTRDSSCCCAAGIQIHQR